MQVRELIAHFGVSVEAGPLDRWLGLLRKGKGAAEQAAVATDKGSASMSAGVAAAARFATGLVAVAGAYIGFSAALSAGRAIVTTSMQFEDLKANLETIEGSAAKAEAAFARVQTFAAKTPFTLDQAVEAYTKLRTLGLDATERSMTAFGNTASAMGKPLMQLIEAVADASTGEFERLKEFGIKAKQQGDKVAFTFKGVTKTVGKDAASIQAYLVGLGETDFAGAMARRSRTLSGIMSNVEDTVASLANRIGESGLMGALKRAALGWLSFLGQLDGPAKRLGEGLGRLVDGFVKVVSNGFRILKAVLRAFGVDLGDGANALDMLAGALEALGNDLGIFAEWLDRTREGMAFLSAWAGRLKFALYLIAPGVLAIAFTALGNAIMTSTVPALIAAGRAAVAFMVANAPIIAIGAAFALLGLIVQDLVVWLNGGDAALGRVFDASYAVGEAFQTWTGIPAIIMAAQEAAGVFFTSLMAAAQVVWAAVSAGAVMAWGIVASAGAAAWSLIVAAVNNAQTSVNALWAAITSGIATVVGAIAAVPAAFLAIGPAIATALGPLGQLVSGAIQAASALAGLNVGGIGAAAGRVAVTVNNAQTFNVAGGAAGVGAAAGRGAASGGRLGAGALARAAAGRPQTRR